MDTRVAQPSLDLSFAADPLDRMSPADIGVAELKALVGEGMAKAAFFEVVRAAGIPAPDLKAWSTQKLNEVIQRLTARRILKANGEISPDWRGRLTLRVGLRPAGRPWRGGCARPRRQVGARSHVFITTGHGGRISTMTWRAPRG